MNRFSNIPVDDDTLIIDQYELIINGISALYQTWIWDGIMTVSLIFMADDVNDFNEDELNRFIIKYAPFNVNHPITQS